MQKTVREDTANPALLKQVDYLDGFQYAGEILQFFPHGEGYVNATPNAVSLGSPVLTYSYNYVYNYTDHLGNVRLSYSKDPASGQLKVLEENNYYPFGLKHKVYNSGKKDFEKETELGIPPVITNVTKTKYDYKFGAKEWQDELGLNIYDFEARGYDPATVRTTTLDPMADSFASQSPYSFLNNNPMIYVDPTGMAADHVYQLNEKTGEMKKIEHNDDATDTLVAENGDVIADNITKAVFNEAESINIQENGLVIDSFNAAGAIMNTLPMEQEGSVNDFLFKLSTYVNKEISWGVYTSENGNGLINVNAYKNSGVKFSPENPQTMSYNGTNYNMMVYDYHTHQTPFKLSHHASDADQGKVLGSRIPNAAGGNYIYANTGIFQFNQKEKTVNAKPWSFGNVTASSTNKIWGWKKYQ